MSACSPRPTPAAIWGEDASGQAEPIISRVTHPRVRDDLRAAGRELGFRI